MPLGLWQLNRLLGDGLTNCSLKSCATVAGKIVQQSLARFFKSYWHDCSTVTGTVVQQSLA